MHINEHNPYQSFQSMSGLSCMLSKTSIGHVNVMNVLDFLSHTDWFLIVCRPRESCQHQTRAGFHWGGDNGLLEGLGGLPRVRGGSQQSHIYLLSIAFVNMDPPVHLTSPLSSLSSYHIFTMGWREVAVSKFGLVQTPKMSVNLINQWELS